MKNPKDCVHPGEHLLVINGDTKKCEICGVFFEHKENAWHINYKRKD